MLDPVGQNHTSALNNITKKIAYNTYKESSHNGVTHSDLMLLIYLLPQALCQQGMKDKVR